MKITTRQFGEIEVAEDSVFFFPAGLYGFRDERRFLVLDMGGPFQYLQSVEDGDVGFVLADPTKCFSDYQPEIGPTDLAEIELADLAEAVVMVIAVVPEDFRDTTVNLQAPVVFNPHKRLGRQVVLGAPGYGFRRRIFPEASVTEGAGVGEAEVGDDSRQTAHK